MRRATRPYRRPAVFVVAGLMAAATGCAAAPRPAAQQLAPATASVSPTITVALPTPASSAPSRTPTPTPTPAATTSRARLSPAPATVSHSTTTHAAPATASSSAPVIVIDPGHSVAISSTDPAFGLNDSDYENEPEMRDVYAVALLVRTKLKSAGYRVVLTKNSLTEPMSLGHRAAVANSAHAALAISIHDQAGTSGGIGFDAGNNTVYDQAVGDYRQNPSGRKIVFQTGPVASASQRCGRLFQQARAASEGHAVRLQDNVGYDLGSRGLAPGNIWIVQLLSDVPWIYNEAGGNSAGTSGLNSADQRRYAAGLVAGVEACVPLH